MNVKFTHSGLWYIKYGITVHNANESIYQPLIKNKGHLDKKENPAYGDPKITTSLSTKLWPNIPLIHVLREPWEVFLNRWIMHIEIQMKYSIKMKYLTNNSIQLSTWFNVPRKRPRVILNYFQANWKREGLLFSYGIGILFQFEEFKFFKI